MQIDRQARARMLDLGLDVDRAAIRLEELKKARAEARIAELTDAETVAAEQAAEVAARRELDEAEARAKEARRAWQNAHGAQEQRGDRIETMRAEIARAAAAIRSTQKLLEREQTERSALLPA